MDQVDQESVVGGLQEIPTFKLPKDADALDDVQALTTIVLESQANQVCERLPQLVKVFEIETSPTPFETGIIPVRKSFVFCQRAKLIGRLVHPFPFDKSLQSVLSCRMFNELVGLGDVFQKDFAVLEDAEGSELLLVFGQFRDFLQIDLALIDAVGFEDSHMVYDLVQVSDDDLGRLDGFKLVHCQSRC